MRRPGDPIMRRHLPAAAAGLALVLAGCQDLAVTNPNEPDRERATQQPVAAEQFVASAFRTWWPNGGHDDYPSWAMSTMAREVTSSFADFGQLETSAEPRSAWNNNAVNDRSEVNEDPWYELYATISTVNDALIAIDSGLVIEDAERTARTQAVGKFLQGISHGYLGLYVDRAFVIDETVAVDTIETFGFLPYTEVVDSAIVQLDAAIAIAAANDFELPVEQFLYTEMSSEELARLANSFAARLLVYSARTPAERAAVDWNEVIRRVDAGVQRDFAPQAQQDILWDDWKRLVARVRVATRPSDFGRPSYWLLGPADTTNGFISWVNTELNARQPFQLQTPDRRIQGAAGPADPGKYVGYNRNSIGAASRGTYRYSWYFFRRFGTGNSWQEGALVALTTTEMNLLKAEALIRLGRADEAVPLVNQSRVANGELPPVTIDGPPDAPGCVPRKLSGACGSLWDALRYEKNLEGLGVSGITAFMDARGWGALPENTPVHFPAPGRELGTLQLPLYTFGGPGGEGSAAAPNPEQCPVALPRCP